MTYLKGGKKKQQQQCAWLKLTAAQARGTANQALGVAPFSGDSVVTMWPLQVPVSNNLVTVY